MKLNSRMEVSHLTLFFEYQVHSIGFLSCKRTKAGPIGPILWKGIW